MFTESDTSFLPAYLSVTDSGWSNAVAQRIIGSQGLSCAELSCPQLLTSATLRRFSVSKCEAGMCRCCEDNEPARLPGCSKCHWGWKLDLRTLGELWAVGCRGWQGAVSCGRGPKLRRHLHFSGWWDEAPVLCVLCGGQGPTLHMQLPRALRAHTGSQAFLWFF